MPLKTRVYEIHTDGACLRNPGPGGWAFVCLQYDSDNVKINKTEINGSIPEATNNVMEYMAVMEALDHIKVVEESLPLADKVHVNIYSDSQLVIQQINGRWKVNNIQLKNLHLIIKSTIALLKRESPNKWNFSFHKEKAHCGLEHNERANILAQIAAGREK